MGIASLVLGIISLLVAVLSGGIWGWLSAILAIIGIILGVVAKKDPKQEGMAKAGMILSIIALVLSLLLYIACVACLVGIGSSIN